MGKPKERFRVIEDQGAYILIDCGGCLWSHGQPFGFPWNVSREQYPGCFAESEAEAWKHLPEGYELLSLETPVYHVITIEADGTGNPRHYFTLTAPNFTDHPVIFETLNGSQIVIPEIARFLKITTRQI